MDDKIDAIVKRLDRLDQWSAQMSRAAAKDMTNVEEGVRKLNDRLDVLESRVSKVESRLNNLDSNE